MGLEGGAYQHPEQSSGGEQGYLPKIYVPPPIKREEQIPTQIVGDIPIEVVQFPTKVEEQPQLGSVVSEGESSQISNAIFKHVWPSVMFAVSPVEDESSNEIPTVKLPRPRNPLIDAVVTHDKSKEVTERMQPPVIPKVDERGSLLEQIRTKSFNLKPAMVTRPSIQGPKTNLRLAAILEKANAIRQALAGSDEDEDDDDDGWSDSRKGTDNETFVRILVHNHSHPVKCIEFCPFTMYITTLTLLYYTRTSLMDHGITGQQQHVIKCCVTNPAMRYDFIVLKDAESREMKATATERASWAFTVSFSFRNVSVASPIR
ncbi:hypothetical protein F3Y22_tig00002841pilonHSYRG00213 [Hibiscus syriacus]|uniref:Protein SCAR n=1 Tax=Hibiscus syriacus TaxID=106335 RepID=A0A6A3CQX2_HIBSY|nr:hypothetical protein F3Y22_tig00002841pilonHSYRG00213 [Hibiscus syriacus]